MSTQQQEVITIDLQEIEDREEGEIVDEFEYILSSEEDEESITKRIRELEDRNDELEKIATISGAVTNYPTDVFEISDFEEEEERYYSSKGRPFHPSKSYVPETNYKHTKRSKPIKKRRPKRKKKIRVCVDESASSDSFDEENNSKVSKDVLRFAVETQNIVAPNKRNLRDRLILDNNPVKIEVEEHEVEPKKEEEDDFDEEEQELRLMALKSAVMNRHSDRVKRKKESTAYSPSDFDAVLNQSPDLMENGIDTPNMDISPTASPASEMSEEDVHPVDMDIGNSEDEEFPVAQFQDEMICSKEDIPKPLPIYQAQEDEEEPEEEEALRALLLSKLNSPKVQKGKPPPIPNDENQENSSAALILKKAVQRLQERKLSCDIVQNKPEPAILDSNKIVESLEDDKILREKPEENVIDLKKQQKPIKRKPVETAVVVPVVPKKPKTNLITAVPSHKVKRLVISLQNSEDEDNELCGDIFTKHFLSTNICLDSENYADAASPSSLLFVENSNSGPSTPRSNSPFVSGNDKPTIKKQITITNDVFEAKLDHFLKNARSQVEQSAKKDVDTKKTVQGTPMAVRHLPESSQAEYRILMKRMELLEKQKELGLKKLQITQQKNKIDTIKITIKNNNPIDPKRIVIKKPLQQTVLATKPSTSQPPVLHAASTTLIPTESKISPPKPEQKAINKEELFHKVETQYNKNGSLLLENLSKNLSLVETALTSKTKKLELEARFSLLAKEMKTIQSELKVEDAKIGKIYPQIRFLHKTMEDLKLKRSKLYKYANTLGKTVKNGQISLKNSQKDEITKNYKNLATRLRALKALNKDNVSLTKDCSTQVELEATIPTDNQNTDVQGDNKKLEEIEETEKTPKKVIEEVAATEEKLKEPETLRIDYVIRPEFILGVIQERRQKKGFRILQWSNEYISPLCFRVNSASSRCVETR